MDNANFISNIPDCAHGDASHRNDGYGTEDRIPAAAGADVPHAVPGRRSSAADLAGGAGIVGWRTALQTGAAQVANRVPEVRAPGRLDLFSDREGTFSS